VNGESREEAPPTAGQPADDHKTSKPDDAYPSKTATPDVKPTRRPKTNADKASRDPWAKDRKKFYEDGLSIAHGAKELKNKLLQCTAAQEQDIREHADPAWLKEQKEAGEAQLFVYYRLTGSAEVAEAEADDLMQKTQQVGRTPAQASTPIQPSA
jgi:hypothetical protein